MATYITIRKIVEKRDNVLAVENDTILLTDIKSFRKWHKTPVEDKQVEGEMCQISIFSATGKEGFYTVRINESAEDFGDRLGPEAVIKLKNA